MTLTNAGTNVGEMHSSEGEFQTSYEIKLNRSNRGILTVSTACICSQCATFKCGSKTCRHKTPI